MIQRLVSIFAKLRIVVKKMRSSWWLPSISLAWRFSSQSLIPYYPRIVLSAATCVIEEGIRFKLDAWTNQRKWRGSYSLRSRLKLAFRSAIRWRWRRKRKCTRPADNGVTLDGAINDTMLAKRRLLLARAAFKAATEELRAAEIGMRHT